MTVRAENALQQLLASGLHRLAQPVSSAIWAVELAKEPAVAPLPHLAAEMRRAAGILHAMRSVMEASSTYADTKPECLNDLIVEAHAQADAALRSSGIVCQPLESEVRICCDVDARGFGAAYRILLDKFLRLGAVPATLRKTLTQRGNNFSLVLECDSPVIAAWAGAQRTQLFQELDPFEIAGFDFSAGMAPELTQARAILDASGIRLTGDLDTSVMRFEMQGLRSIPSTGIHDNNF